MGSMRLELITPIQGLAPQASVFTKFHQLPNLLQISYSVVKEHFIMGLDGFEPPTFHYCVTDLQSAAFNQFGTPTQKDQILFHNNT